MMEKESGEKTLKILIVDDSLMDRKLLMNVLRKNGIESEFLEAVDGEQGIKILSTNYQEVRLILLDWQMPKMDGIAFMKGVLQVPEVSAIPIIMITASSSDDNRKYAHEVNPKLAGYIVKPFRPDQLVEIVKPFLD
jgi:two-component system chemotaxis response regulator CheY